MCNYYDGNEIFKDILNRAAKRAPYRGQVLYAFASGSLHQGDVKIGWTFRPEERKKELTQTLGIDDASFTVIKEATTANGVPYTDTDFIKFMSEMAGFSASSSYSEKTGCREWLVNCSVEAVREHLPLFEQSLDFAAMMSRNFQPDMVDEPATQVLRWSETHPLGTLAQAIEDLDLPKDIVSRYWDRFVKKNRRSQMAKAVAAWQKKNPYLGKAACARALGISWSTVDRWWNPSDFMSGKERILQWKEENPEGRPCEAARALGISYQYCWDVITK